MPREMKTFSLKQSVGTIVGKGRKRKHNIRSGQKNESKQFMRETEGSSQRGVSSHGERPLCTACFSYFNACSMQQTWKNTVSICDWRFIIPVLCYVQVKLREHRACMP